MTTRHILYRAYSHRGALLYVGKTANPGVRLRKHAEAKSFWGEVDRIELQHFRSGDALDKAEKQAIAREKPLYNVHHNPHRADAIEAERQRIELLEELHGEEELYGWFDSDGEEGWEIEEYAPGADSKRLAG